MRFGNNWDLCGNQLLNARSHNVAGFTGSLGAGGKGRMEFDTTAGQNIFGVWNGSAWVKLRDDWISGVSSASGSPISISGTQALTVDIALASGSFLVGNGSNVARATVKSSIPISGFGAAQSAVNFGSQRLTNVGTPVDPADACPKSYVDEIGSGIEQKAPCRVAMTEALPAHSFLANIMTASGNGALPAIDGVTLEVGDRLLYCDDEGGSHLEFGIYAVTALGDASHPWILTRAGDADESSEVDAGLYTPITEGTVWIGSSWRLITDNPTLNTTALTFQLFMPGQQFGAGRGMVKVGTELHFGQSTAYTAYALPYASDASTISFLAPNSTATRKFLRQVSSGAPAWDTLTADDIPSLDAAKVTTGAFHVDRIPSLDAGKVTTGAFHVDRIPSLPTTKITSGNLDIGRLPVGLNTCAAGDVIYASGADTWARLAANATATRKFIRQVSGAAPAWDTLQAGDIPSLAASIITSGNIDIARLPSGIAAAAAGDVIYASATNTWARLAANGTATRKFIRQVSGAAPAWDVLVEGDIPSLDASKIMGTFAIGRLPTGLNTCTAGDVVYASGADTWARLTANGTATRKFLRQVSGAAPAWDTLAAGDIPTHAHTIANVTLLQTSLDLKADRAVSHAPAGLYFDGSTANTRVYATLTGQTIGTGDFSLRVKFRVPSAAPPAASYTELVILGQGNSSVSEYGLQVYFGETGAIAVQIHGTTGNVRWASVADFISTYGGQVVELVITRTSAGLGWYVNGQAVTETSSGTTGATPPAWNGSIISSYLVLTRISGTPFSGNVYAASVFNLALAAADVLDIFKHGIPAKYQWGAATETITTQTNRDFSVSVGDWVGTRCSIARDAVNNELDVAVTDSSSYVYFLLPVASISRGLNAGRTYKFSYTIRNLNIKSGATVSAQGAATNEIFKHSIVANGTYTHVNTLAIAGATAFLFSLNSVENGNSFSLDDVSIVQVGAIVDLDFEHANPALSATITDLSNNALHGTIVGGISQTRWIPQLNCGELVTTAGTLTTLLAGKANSTHNHAASAITSGTLDAARIPSLDASKITTGSLDASVTIGSKAICRKVTASVPIGTTTLAISHGLNTTYLDVKLCTAAGEYLGTDFDAISASQVQLSFANATTEAFTAVILG